MSDLPEFVSGPTVAGAIAFILIVLARIPTVNRRLSRFLDPLVRWWTRGALVDQVNDREREILFRRTQDVDIIESYLVEVSRWSVEVRIAAGDKGVELPAIKTYREYKADWIRDHPGYAETRRSDGGGGEG